MVMVVVVEAEMESKNTSKKKGKKRIAQKTIAPKESITKCQDSSYPVEKKEKT